VHPVVIEVEESGSRGTEPDFHPLVDQAIAT
jgi:hypothetical protein